MPQLLQATFGPQTVIGEEFDLAGVDAVLIYGSWVARHHGPPARPRTTSTSSSSAAHVDVLIVGSPYRADVHYAADRAQVRLGMRSASIPIFRTSSDQAPENIVPRVVRARPPSDRNWRFRGTHVAEWPVTALTSITRIFATRAPAHRQ